MKTSLTVEDEMKLEAARGLIKTGLRPSAQQYNHAITAGKYCGSPIIPIGAITSDYGHNRISLDHQRDGRSPAPKAKRKANMGAKKPNKLRKKDSK